MDENDPLQPDLAEPLRLVAELKEAGVALVNLSCGSPYSNPHVQRPAIFPPSDGYQPPEDPLVGVARQINAVRECKNAAPDIPLVGTGYTYLQDYLPHVAQAAVREGWVDFVGLGRMVLSYPRFPRRRVGTRRPATPFHLPNFQRLHHRSPQRHAFGLLPSRPFLQGAPRVRSSEADQEGPSLGLKSRDAL